MLLKRQEREQAEKRRAEKNARKVVAPAPTHRRVVEAPLDRNSVAARRLAAKRGQPVGQPRVQSDFADFSSSPSSSASSATAESLFFSDSDFSSSSFSASFSSSFAGEQGGFDAFGTSVVASASSSASFGSSGGFTAFDAGASGTSGAIRGDEGGFGAGPRGPSAGFNEFSRDEEEFSGGAGNSFSAPFGASQDAFASSDFHENPNPNPNPNKDAFASSDFRYYNAAFDGPATGSGGSAGFESSGLGLGSAGFESSSAFDAANLRDIVFDGSAGAAFNEPGRGFESSGFDGNGFEGSGFGGTRLESSAFDGNGFESAERAFEGAGESGFEFDSRSKDKEDGFDGPAFPSRARSESGQREFGWLPPSESNRNSLDREHHDMTDKLAVFAPFGDAPFETFDAPKEASFGGNFEEQQGSFDAFGSSPVHPPPESIFDSAPSSSSAFSASFDSSRPSSSAFPASSSAFASPFAAATATASGNFLEEDTLFGVFDKKGSPVPSRLSPRPSPTTSTRLGGHSGDDSINLLDTTGSFNFSQDLLGPAVGGGGGGQLDLLSDSSVPPTQAYAADFLEAQASPSSIPTLQPRPQVTAPDQLLSLFDQPKPDPFSTMVVPGAGMGMPGMSSMNMVQSPQRSLMGSPMNPMGGSIMGGTPQLPPMLMGMVQNAQANLHNMQSPPVNPFKPMMGQAMGQPLGQSSMQPQMMQPQMMGQAMAQAQTSMGGGSANTGGKLQPTRGLTYEIPGASQRDPFSTLSSFPKT